MKAGLLLGAALLASVGFVTHASAQSGVWGQTQGIWSSSGKTQSGLWQANSAVWSAGANSAKGAKAKGGHGAGQSGAVPHALMGMKSLDEDRVTRDKDLTRLARKAAGIDPDNPGQSGDATISPGYVDQFGLSHPGSIVMNGQRVIAMPENANTETRNYGAAVPSPPRSASDGSPTGGAITGTFIASPNQERESALLDMAAKEGEQ